VAVSATGVICAQIRVVLPPAAPIFSTADAENVSDGATA